MRKIGLLTALFATASWLTACSGPHTPMGAIYGKGTAEPDQVVIQPMSRADLARMPEELQPKPKITFLPERQLIHAQTELVVDIFDPDGVADVDNVRFFYDKYDVTQVMLFQADKRFLNGNRHLRLKIKNFRLPANREHAIAVYYRPNKENTWIYSSYLPPSCLAYGQKKVKTTGKFRVPDGLLEKIQQSAVESGYNPAYYTGLIAQESGFNPHAVSWAKAIGLTQVTSLAEQTILEKYPSWPSNPLIKENNYLWVKNAISNGLITRTNEWRLDPNRSVVGGITYMNYLVDYWNMPHNKQKLRDLYGSHHDEELTKILLASYNSGAARVNLAIDRYGKKWLTAPSLGEARKYVNRIFSFCYHFAHEENVREIKNDQTT